MSTVKEIILACEKLGVKPPSGLVKAELNEFYHNLVYATETGLSLEISSEERLTSTEFKAKLKPKSRDPQLDWIDHLIEYGWTTVEVKGLDVEKIKDAFYQTLETCSYVNSGEPTNFKRDMPETWSDLPPNLHGIFKNNFGHFPWQWEVREKCIPIFAQLCETDQLLTSFDGACFLSPGKSMSGSWFHCDQGRQCGLGCVCFQGVVTLTQSGPQDGGLVVIEKSHQIFEQYLETHPLFGFTWGKVNVKDPLINDLDFVKVCAPAGHILLFDSRTFHCNIPPERKTGEPRMAVYVSMLGKANAEEKELKKRQEAFDKLRMTSHWAYGPWFDLNPAVPRSWGKDYLVPQESLPILNKKQKDLIA